MSEGRPAAHPLRGLLTAQFLGAFNDNALKLLVALLAIGAVPAGASEAASQARTTLVFVVFTLPFLLLSLPAGALADRWSKRSVIVAAKGVEGVLMAAATLVLLFRPGDWIVALVVVGLMGAQSAFFSPAKYGILPEALAHEKLSRANALLEGLTFLAIIAGTAAGGVALDLTRGDPWLAGTGLTVLAGLGFLASLEVPRTPPAGRERRVLASVRGAWKAVRAERTLWLTVLGLAWFWGVTSLLGQDVLVYAKTALGLSDTLAGGLLAVFGLGVAVGAWVAALLSGDRVETGLIPLGAGLFALFTGLLAGAAPQAVGTFVLVACMGAGSGLLVVPLNALLQWRAPAERRGGVIALSNLFVFTGILAGTLGAGALAGLGWSSREILVGAALLTLGGTLWALWLLPDALLRLVLVLLTHTFYRLEVVGGERVPARGGALLVANHVSFADGLFLLASLDRGLRFVVEASWYERWWLRPFLRSMGAIPVTADGGPRVVLRALREAGRSLDEGHLVCIFAEGQITRTGFLLPFRRGFERIVKGRDVPVVPVHLDRVWGSVFSRSGGRFLWKLPERIPYPVTVSFGEPLPAETHVHDVRRAVTELGETSWRRRSEDRPPLHHSFVRNARRRPWALALADGEGTTLRRIKVLGGAIALARTLREDWEGQRRVGVLLPPSVAGVLVNAAAALAGRTVVNLNYTAGRAALASAIHQAGLESVVTSEQFLEKAPVGREDLPEGLHVVLAEELRDRVGSGARMLARILALAAPVRLIERLCGAPAPVRVEDPATIIFSSGSTGEPKGVVLSHFNLDSNVQAAAQVLHPGPEDRALGILPFFHSFGTFLLWFALNRGVAAVLHPTPLDAAAVGELVERFRVTILVATPTFLRLYLRRVPPGKFGSLRLVVTGAEKLPPTLAEAFAERFGIAPMEGYGTTECAPVVAVNVPGYRAPGFFQQGGRPGSVGHPLPGVAVRIVDPDSGEPLAAGEEGMVLVRGPNVMEGYLDREDLTREALRDGWYTTGDIGKLDEEGFLHITDRLARFAKIGGEMVPHGRVEQALQEASGRQLQAFAVTSVPDERKGERLAVLTTLPLERIPALLEKVAEAGLPNLFLPRREDFVSVDEIPLLGTGKLDLRAVRSKVLESQEGRP